MKRYQSPLILTTTALSVFCLVLLASSTEIPAMGQTGFELATLSQASPEDVERPEGEESPEDEENPEDVADEEWEPEEPDGLITDNTLLPSEDAIPQAVQLRTATGSNTEPLEVVTVIAVPSNLVIEAEAGRAEEMISQAFRKDPTGKNAAVKLSDGSRRVFPIEYDYASLEEAGTGLVMLPGTITPPDGCHISPELAETELPILLYSPEEPCELPVTSVEPLSRTQILLPEHAVLDDLIQGLHFERNVDYILDGGLTWSARISWTFDAVDFGTPGTYWITARPLLPDGIFLPDGLPELTLDVIIQPDDAFLLGPPEFTGLYMVSQWTKETPDLEKFRCFYAIGDGPWIEDAKQDLLSIPSHAPQSFQVFYYEDVFFDTPYYFKLAYDGEYSNILKVYFSGEQIHYRFYDGDRDGGDREEQKPPNISQTVPPGLGSTWNGAGTEGTLPPETTAPETPGAGETPPAETPTPDHSSGDSAGSSGNKGSHGSSFAHKGASGNGYVPAGPGMETRAASPLSPSLPASTPPMPEPGKENLSAAYVAGSVSDGPDSGGANFPAGVKTGSALEAKSEAALEEDTTDYTVYSGQRLLKYIELNPGLPLHITKHRIQVEIPMENPVFTRLEDSSLLRVAILSLSEDTIRVELSIDGVSVPLDELPELTVTIPYVTAGEDVSLQVLDTDGTVLTEARPIDRAHITFTVNKAGTFRIQGTSGAGAVPAFPAEHDGPLSDTLPADGPGKEAAVMTVLFLFALSGLFFIRRTRGSGEKHGEKNAGRNAGKYAERNAGKCSGRNAGKCSERNAGKCVERNAGKYAERSAGKCSERNAGKCSERNTGKCSERNTEGISPESIGEKTEKHMKNHKKGGERP